MPHRYLAPVIVVLIVLQFLVMRTPQPLILPEQRTAIGQNAKIGVHTRLTGIGDQALIQRTLTQVHDMGAHWVVDLFPWAYIQPRSRYGWDWTGADLVMQHAARQGLTVIARLDIVPQWARPRDSSDRFIDAAHYADYAAFVTAVLERYRPLGLRHVIIWNEPNLAFEWGRRTPDPEAYAALLKVVYPRVKAAVPDAIVIAGALSPGPSLGDHAEVRLDDLEYTRRFYAAGGDRAFDLWGVHAYGGQAPYDAAPDPSVVNFRRVEVVHQLLASLGDPNRRLIITEGGWNDYPRWSAAVSPSNRLRWTLGAFALAQQWPWLDAVCMWQFSLPQPARTYQDGWTFVMSDGTPKAIYWAVREANVGAAPP